MIQIYIDAKISKKKNTSSFAVILKHDHTTWKRSLINGSNTLNNALLNSVKYGMLSISQRHSAIPVKIYTRNKFILDIFSKGDDGEYRIIPTNNVEVIEEIKCVINDRNVEFILDSSGLIDDCNDMSHKLIETNEPVFIKN